MRTKILIILTLAFSNVFSQSNQPAEKLRYKLVELKHGLGTPKETRPAVSKDSSPWSQHNTREFTVIRATDSIPAKLNTVFGVEFQVNGKQTADLAYTQEWIYPVPMKENDGRKYRSAKTNATMSSNTPTHCYYTLDEPYELLEGQWTLNIYIENELKYSHHFIVY